MDFASVALDTSVLFPPTARRFFMAAWELQGLAVPVLPRVSRELYGVMPDGERRYWSEVLKGQARREGLNYDDDTKFDIFEAVDNASRQWINETLDTQQEPQGCALKSIGMGHGDLVRAFDLGNAIPSEYFSGASVNDHNGDREIVGQATIMGYSVLLSNNRRSIRREPVNQWLRENAGINSDLLQDPDVVVQRLHATSAGLRYSSSDMLKAVLLACLPDVPRPPEREDEIVTSFLSNLRNVGMTDCVAGMSGLWATAEGRELVDVVRANHIQGSPARATEASRLAAVRTRRQTRRLEG